jgi:hypothetical protein
MNSFKELLAVLDPSPVGCPAQLEAPLAACWSDFQGANEGGMAGNKLLGRMECVNWRPPILTFVIERHGWTACGSTRAQLQHWEVDLDKRTAAITKTGHRQLAPLVARLSIKSLADELVKTILRGQADHRLVWSDSDSVRVLPSRIFPAGPGFKATLASRRAKLCQYIGANLAPHGWIKSNWNAFRRGNVQAPVNNERKEKTT